MRRRRSTYSRQSSRNKAFIIFLIGFLIIVGSWTTLKAYRYFNAPHEEKSIHLLYLEIETNKNLTLGEVLGYRNDTEGKYVIIQKGGIYFYTLSPGWNFTRELEITNRAWYPVDVETSADGNIAQFLTIDLPSKTLEPKSSAVVNLTILLPTENVIAGKYGGNLTIRLIPKKA